MGKNTLAGILRVSQCDFGLDDGAGGWFARLRHGAAESATQTQ